MRLDEFSFDLPAELIAQNPVTPRDQARLLVYNRQNGSLSHHIVADLPRLLPPHTVLTANNSKVRQARLHALCNGRNIEVLILEPAGGREYDCLVGGRGVQPGDQLTFLTVQDEPLNMQGTVVSREEGPGMTTYRMSFSLPPNELEDLLEAHGGTPLPPYITHSTSTPDQYQTVYAQDVGSAAAPTAGLHFTPRLIQELRDKGFTWEEVTLHVGMGTFLPLRHEEITDNRLHEEHTLVTEETAERLNQAKAAGQTLLAVGTTATRTLESHTEKGVLQAGRLNTDLFIYPGYQFQTVSALMTNFHLPKSSLLLLVAAFLGNDPRGRLTKTEAQMTAELQHIYQTAIKERYRFFSFGDTMLIL